MKSIARACGVTEAALYRHFDSKEALYEAVILSLKRRLDPARALARLETADGPEDLLASLARTLLATFNHHPEIHRILYQCSLERHSMCSRAFQDLRAPFVSFLAARLSDWSASGVVRPIDPQITARCFVGMVMDCCISTHLWEGGQGKPIDPEAVIRNNVSIYVEGLVPRSRPSRRPAITAARKLCATRDRPRRSRGS